MDADLLTLKKRITNNFKLCGFLIRSENSSYLAEQLLPFDGAERDKWLTVITQNLQGQKLATPHVERASLEKAINELNRVGLDEGETVFALIDAFTVPRFRYNSRVKKFELDARPRQLLTAPSMKSDYMQQRYAMLLKKPCATTCSLRQSSRMAWVLRPRPRSLSCSLRRTYWPPRR